MDDDHSPSIYLFLASTFIELPFSVISDSSEKIVMSCGQSAVLSSAESLHNKGVFLCDRTRATTINISELFKVMEQP